jgi:tetratricopeptide (TPR) repeat protein
VLVALYDGKPVPKVIDFGVAKAVAQPLTDRTLVTEFGAVVGTLEYMSPEQAELNQLDIDTRSDVYSLGVLLYELLTGTTPLDRKRQGPIGFAEILRRIREDEPPKPSTRLRSSDTLPDIAAARRTEPARLTRLVRGELDWIVMRALEKDRNRRYETANGLARDVERYLSDEPVAAGPPGAGYRLKKFLRRHRGPVLAASVVLLALVLGIVGTTYGMVWALAAEGVAREEQTRAEQAKDKEAAERKQAEAVSGLLVSVFRQVDPDAEKKGGLGLKEQLLAELDRAAANLQKEYAGQPLVRARLRSALGETQLGLGEWAKAQALFRAAVAELGSLLGEGHPDTLAVQSNLGLAYQGAGRAAESIQVLEQVRDRQVATLGPDDPATVTTLNNLGRAYRQVGRAADAIKLLERVRDRRVEKLGLKHTDTLSTLSSLGLAYRDAGRTADALKLLERTRDLAAEVNGPDHPETLAILTNLAAVYRDAGRAADAIALHKHVRAAV